MRLITGKSIMSELSITLIVFPPSYIKILTILTNRRRDVLQIPSFPDVLWKFSFTYFDWGHVVYCGQNYSRISWKPLFLQPCLFQWNYNLCILCFWYILPEGTCCMFKTVSAFCHAAPTVYFRHNKTIHSVVFFEKTNFFFNTTMILSYTKGSLPLCLISGLAYAIPGLGRPTVADVSFGFPLEGCWETALRCGPSESHSDDSGSQEELWQPQGFGFRSVSGHVLLGAKWHPTLLERHGVRGQLHQYNLPDPTPWPLERSVSPVYFGHWDASNSCMCHIYAMTVDKDKGKDTFLNVCKTWGWLAQANSVFDAAGQEAGSPLYCWEMDGPRTCRGLLLAPRQSYQLRLNLSFWLVQITFEVPPVCPRCSIVFQAECKETLSCFFFLSKGSRRGYVGKLRRIILPFEELFISSLQTMTSSSVTHSYIQALCGSQLDSEIWCTCKQALELLSSVWFNNNLYRHKK